MTLQHERRSSLAMTLGLSSQARLGQALATNKRPVVAYRQAREDLAKASPPFFLLLILNLRISYFHDETSKKPVGFCYFGW